MSWGNYDNAANAPLFAVNAGIVKNNPTHAAPTRANVTLLYANTTPNVYTQNETIGLFNIDAQEIAAVNADYDYENGTEEADAHFVHTGWNIVTTGQGGRAGRIQTECLVALNNVRLDGDGQLYPNVAISFVGLSNASVLANASYANTATFAVTPKLAGNTAATLTYAWQTNNAAGTRGWTTPTNIANIHFTGVTTASLGVQPANAANTTDVYRLVITAADQGVTATSANATITIA